MKLKKQSLFNQMILSFLITSLLCSCSEEQFSSDIIIELNVLNEDSLVQSEFNEGENIIFSLTFINESGDDIWFDASSFDRQDFLRVYGINQTENTDLIDFGKPYEGLFCSEVASIKIPADDFVEFAIPWSAPKSYFPLGGIFFCVGSEAEALPSGDYYTQFSSDFSFSQGEDFLSTGTREFRVDFSIR